MSLTRRSFLSAAAVVGMTPRLPMRPGPVQAQASDRFDPWIEVDAGALAYNVDTVSRLTDRPILAVAKNNAYGLGIDLVARLLEPMPAIAGFAVVRVAEAHALRDAGVRKPVLLMARASDAQATDLVRRGIELAVCTDDDPRRYAALSNGDEPVTVHFYVDTGMSRMGVPYHRALPVARDIGATSALRVAGVFMAFTEETEFDREQLRRFTTLLAELDGAGVPTGRRHAASSNGVFHLPEARLDLVRPGIALYGAYPSRPEEERRVAELRPAFRLRARVVRVERLRGGDTVSYGRRYEAAGPVWIATLPVGHADGYPRRAVEGARVLIGDVLYPVIGAVSASHTIIEVGAEQTVRVGDIATLLGPDDPAIHPNAVASATGASVYDLLMHLNPLLPRVAV